MFPQLTQTIQKLAAEFNDIDTSRHPLLHDLTSYIQEKYHKGHSVNLIFICTHNSRRSHMAQLWAQAAAHYYKIPRVACFSGGTEVTAFNSRAVAALQEVGFNIACKEAGDNPLYSVSFSDDAAPIDAFSKKYDDASIGKGSFAAIMTCSHADEHCPFIPGAEQRIPMTFNDPKDYDGTALEREKYHERVEEIGREILFAFSQVRIL